MGRNPYHEIRKRIAAYLGQNELTTEQDKLLLGLLQPSTYNSDEISTAFRSNQNDHKQKQIEKLEARLAALKGGAQ